MNSRPFTILIVSPDRLRLRELSKFLDVFGYDVRQATDAAKALAAAEAARPDFLILDAKGSQPVDLQLCQSVRRLWSDSYTYCLFLTEKREVGDVTAALEAGFDDFLTAPLVFGELLARLRAGARLIEYERRMAEHRGCESFTGLADGAALQSEFQRRSQAATGPAGCLALIELDYFQRLADRLGGAAAQDAFKQVAQLVRGNSPEGVFLAAPSGDAIAALLPAGGSQSPAAWCQQVLSQLAETSFTVGDGSVRLTASCGLAEIIGGQNWEATESQVQKALGLAKASGRGCVVTSDEVERDAEDWAARAADGKLFQTTLARDVMHLCPLLLHYDETLEQAHALLSQTGLTHAPVVDTDNSLAGLVSIDQLSAARLRGQKPKGSGGSSVRLVRHVMTTDVTRFDEQTPLADLMEFFTGESATLAIIVRGKKPRGLVHCHALAALNDRLTVNHFASAKPRQGTSADLLVPDLALAE